MDDGTTPDLIINPHCLIAGTRIEMSDGTTKRIEDIFDKDLEIATVDPVTLEKSVTRYKDGFRVFSDEVMKVITSTGHIVCCTRDHLLLTVGPLGQHWKKASELVLDADRLFVKKGDIWNASRVIGKESLVPQYVYDFTTISGNHSFVANDIVSHNCIPSRMTINQLIETLANGLVVHTGVRHDATPFSESSTDIVPKIREALKSAGLNPDGMQKLRNGFTGEEIDSEIFMGLTHYQRLKHMVRDKVHARAHGDLQVLTRQPLEGRSRDGGMRSGEMERDCLLGHGAVQFLQEKLLDLSDYFEIDVCQGCYKISNKDCCLFCGGDDIVPVKLPYACKLLFHELMAMGLRIDIIPD